YGVPGMLTRLLVALVLLLAPPARASERLPALGAEGASVTVSGVSSGAFMAVQFHVAHSATVRGAGAIAGGPYDCARGSLWTALTSCMDPGPFSPLPDARRLAELARGLAKAGGIDPVERLAGAKLWLFTGTRDDTVSPEVSRRCAASISRSRSTPTSPSRTVFLLAMPWSPRRKATGARP